MKEWLIISNPDYFDIVGAFQKFKEINFKQSTNIQVGDIVYIYVSSPFKEIKYKCIASKVDMEEREIDTSIFHIDDSNYKDTGRYMSLILMEEYNDVLLYDDLKDNGLKSVQGPSKLS